MIIGITGTIGSGKGVAAKHLKRKYHFNTINLGNIIRSIAKKEHVEPTRDKLHRLQEKYHKKHGKDYIISLAFEKINKNKWKNVAIDGIRLPEQAIFAKRNKIKLIFIDASPVVRFERMKKRHRHNYSKTLQQFKKEEAKEWKNFNLRKTFSYADYKIFNNGSEKELFKKIDKIMKKLK